MVSPLERCLDVNKKAAGVTSRRSFVSTQPVLSSALLTAALSAAALLAATLFFAFVWILLCVHDNFLVITCFGRLHLATGETQTQGAGWLFYQAKPYQGRHDVIQLRQAVTCKLAFGSVTQAFYPVMGRFNLGELTGNKFLS
jgi:hypothetical protein